MTKKYKTLENAKRGFQKIVREWASWLEMDKKLWIVKFNGAYTLQDGSPVWIEAWPDEIDKVNRIIDMDKIVEKKNKV